MYGGSYTARLVELKAWFHHPSSLRRAANRMPRVTASRIDTQSDSRSGASRAGHRYVRRKELTVTQPVRSLLPPLLSALLALSLSGGALASSPQIPAHGSAVHMDAVKISITMTGATVWGTVAAKYTSHGRTTQRACSAASCTFRVPQGVTLRLRQTATNSATWPFKDWQVTVHQRTQTKMGNSIAFKVTGSSAVTAVYVLAQSSSGGNGW